MTARRILIMGGTGVFGKRLARHLSRFEGIEVFISSRTQAKAEAVAQNLKAAHPRLKVQGIALDHAVNLAATLTSLKPFAVIDCSGPFQNASYEAARTILSAGAHFIDLADARDYLADFATALNDTARTKGVSALTGASSTPTLSACVVKHIAQNWHRVDTIDICITPGGKSEVGRSVIEAILSYAGKDVPIWQDGHLASARGWGMARSVTLPTLGRRRVALVETYDAQSLGPAYQVRERVSFSAGLESRLEQHGIETIAALRKRHLFPHPSFLIPLLLWARNLTRIPTSDAGGMQVELTGIDATGRATKSTWNLIAKRDHGPFIPVLPAAAALAKLLTHEVPSGAYFAHEHLSLDDILQEMIPYAIETQTEETQIGATPSKAGR